VVGMKLYYWTRFARIDW